MITEAINDIELLKLLDIYLSNGEESFKTSDVLKKLSEGTKKQELIIPILGSQGMGKSTLINAILGENILPNEADETTCVPVEIKYGAQKKTFVHFTNGKSKEIESNCDSLKEYVDNNENAGNEKEVSRIVLEMPNKLLENGLVLVDLPGVGSLTQNNHETTMRYINNLCTAIFVIPTVPTIRRTEELFIRGSWKTFSSAIFVQNRWDDESDKEVEESVRFNTNVLNNIANTSNTKFSGKICVVNAYQAIVSQLQNNPAAYVQSNLQSLIQEIKNFKENRIEIELQNFKIKLITYIEQAIDVINQNLKENKMTQEELIAERKRIGEEFNRQTLELQKIIDEILEYLVAKTAEANEFAISLSKRSSENLRADIFKLIDTGIVDGEQLTIAFSDYQKKYMLDAIEENYYFLSKLNYELEKKLAELSNKINFERANSFESQTFERKEAFKFEKGLEAGIDLTGALAGSIAGIKIGTALGGPLGAAIGLVAGLGISIFSGLVGKKTRKEITSQRGSQAKRAIKPYIKEFEDKLCSTISNNIRDTLENVADVLNEYQDDRNSHYQSILKESDRLAREKYHSPHNEAELIEHLKYLSIKREAIQ